MTPLQEKRRRNKAFERLAGVESKYQKPWDPGSTHPVALALIEPISLETPERAS